MASLFNTRHGFYLCNPRRGCTLRWDRLITPFSEPLNPDKRKLTPWSSCSLCSALPALYLSQHDAIRLPLFFLKGLPRRKKIYSAERTTLASEILKYFCRWESLVFTFLYVLPPVWVSAGVRSVGKWPFSYLNRTQVVIMSWSGVLCVSDPSARLFPKRLVSPLLVNPSAAEFILLY